MARMRMEVKQCSKGHFYSGEYGSCPFCSGGMDSGIKGTEYNAPPVVDDISVTEPMDPTKTNSPAFCPPAGLYFFI